MKNTIGCIIGLVFVVSALAEPLLEGRVRLDSGEPVADAQVRLFDLSDLQRGAIARATTDGTGYFALPLAALVGKVLPESFTLGQNYPNPFNPSTLIPYQLAASSQVRLEVFNLLGQRIATLVDGERSAGFHTATWHATDAAGRAVGAGVYIYRMTVEAESQTGRMVLIDGQAGVSAGGAASVMPGASGDGGSNGEGAQAYGLIVSGSGLVPYVDPAFQIEAGMTPVELVVSEGQHSAGKATDDDCAFCDLFDTFNDQQEEEEEDLEEEDLEEEEDLIVYASVNDNTPTPGQAFTLRARVQNQGTDEFQDLVLSYYRSSDATISTQDMLLGTDEVGSLAASSTSGDESISLTASSTSGTYYYGACVASVNDEGDTLNYCSTGIRVIVADEEDQISIPDANLQAAIEAALGKASGAMITVAEMMALSTLKASDVVISDLTGLEFAVNLTELVLYGSNISDLSPLSGLTKLTSLWLGESNISDIAPLSGLTKLRFLGLHNNNISDIAPLLGLTNLIRLFLHNNNISDIAPLSGLTNLIDLNLHGNNISDIAPLAGLTGLRFLGLHNNNISDIAPLSGLTKLIRLFLYGNNISDIAPLASLTNLTDLKLGFNPIDDVSALRGLTRLTDLKLRGIILFRSSINDHIPALERSGVTIISESFRESDFDIELVFLDRFTEKQKRIIQYAARRWESIITEDLPDHEFTQGWSGTWGDQSYEIPAGERIDDLRIYVVSQPDETGYDWGGVRLVRPPPHLPILGGISVSVSVPQHFLEVALHEIGHVMGIGTLWGDSVFLQDFPSADPHFNGPRAIAAFNAAGGHGYTGAKVPVETKGRGAGSHWRSSVFLGELMDWTAQVDSPSWISFGPLSAITIQSLADLGWVVDVTQADPYTLPDVAAKASAKIAAPATHAEPEWSCGVGEQREPIYVVDEQGSIVRTLGY